MFFFKQNTAYDMRISYLISDVCSSDLNGITAISQLRQDHCGPEQKGREIRSVPWQENGEFSEYRGGGVDLYATHRTSDGVALRTQCHHSHGAWYLRKAHYEIAGIDARIDRKSTRLNSSH